MVIPGTCALLAEELGKFSIAGEADPLDDAVLERIELFLPYRNEAVQLFLSLALYRDVPELRTVLHRFFERLIPFLDPPRDRRSYPETAADNFRFIVHELLLYAIAALVRHERFESAAHLLSSDYYLAGHAERGRDSMVPFSVFRRYMESLQVRNRRLSLRRLSLRADLLAERCKGTGIEFREVMQADFILFLRDQIDRRDDLGSWWPETLLYAHQHAGAFEVFARSQSSRYFDRAKILLGIESRDQLRPLLEDFAAERRRLPRWEVESFNPSNLLGFNQLCTKP